MHLKHKETNCRKLEEWLCMLYMTERPRSSMYLSRFIYVYLFVYIIFEDFRLFAFIVINDILKIFNLLICSNFTGLFSLFLPSFIAWVLGIYYSLLLHCMFSMYYFIDCTFQFNIHIFTLVNSYFLLQSIVHYLHSCYMFIIYLNLPPCLLMSLFIRPSDLPVFFYLSFWFLIFKHIFGSSFCGSFSFSFYLS